MKFDTFIFVRLIQNTAILLSFSLLYEKFWVKNFASWKFVHKISVGLIIGVTSVILMMTPWILIPGIVFDTRSVLLSISGLFFGFLPTMIGVIISVIYRYELSGPGVWMGIAVIVTSGMLGVFWGKFRKNWMTGNYIKELIYLSTLVHMVMISCGLLLPAGYSLETMKIILLPIIIVYIPATVFMGTLMVSQLTNWKNRHEVNLAAELLRKSEKKFRELFEHIPDAIFLIRFGGDNHGEITSANKAAEWQTGYTIDELIGMNIDKILPADRYDNGLSEERKGLLEKENIIKFEEKKKRKDGSLYWSEVSLKKMSIGNEQVTISINRDISERKSMEEEILKLKDGLELQVKEKTKELNEKLTELQRFFDASVNRELRMKQLYDKSERLEEELKKKDKI